MSGSGTFSYRLLSNRPVRRYSSHFALYRYNTRTHHLVSEEYVQIVCCVAHRVFILFVQFLSFLLISIYFSHDSVSHLCADTESERSVKLVIV
jgi:hypothetical protein